MVPPVIFWKRLDRDAWVIASRTGAGISRSWAVMNDIASLGAVRRARRLPASHRLRTLAAAVQALFPSITSRRAGSGAGAVSGTGGVDARSEPVVPLPLRSGSAVPEDRGACPWESGSVQK